MATTELDGTTTVTVMVLTLITVIIWAGSVVVTGAGQEELLALVLDGVEVELEAAPVGSWCQSNQVGLRVQLLVYVMKYSVVVLVVRTVGVEMTE